MENADKWVQPTKFTGEWGTASWAGYEFLDWTTQNAYHPGEDYNFGAGDQDFGQDVVASSSGVIVHTSKLNTGYGNLIVIKHSIGYNLKRFIKERYGIDTAELFSLYAHLNTIDVKVGQFVKTSQKIGTIGKTGTTWAHLHFEIYHILKDLKGLDWRFYPTGWSKEKVIANWLPAYKFIEATKQISDFTESFLGKPKEYWLQVEKDRESLLQQLGQKDADWAMKFDEQKKSYEIEIGTLNKLVLDTNEAREKAENQAKKQTEDFIKKEENYKKEIELLKIQNSQLIDDNAENYKFWEAIRLAFSVLKKKISL